MIPSIVADEISTGLKEYVRREFPVANAFFIDDDGRTVVDRFLDKKDDLGRATSLVKGPWVELKLPFKKADRTCDKFFPNLAGTGFIDSFTPYLHQMRAFERLNSDSPKSTIVATGTGSGKTECFLLPILDYCARHSGEDGIKAVIIYPMNALAADQEKRLAGYIFKIGAARKVKITAGIYTGDTANHYGASPFKEMTQDHIIRDRNQLCSNPPDILLTNYKMLDFLLVRPDEQSLWKSSESGTCRFIVVDELHTFDGAQGTDLSCLIRRLKDRLGLDQHTACIGTSATLGGEKGSEELCRFASEIFDVTITPDDGLITEDRLNPDDYLNSFGACVPLGCYPLDTISGVKKSSMSGYIRDVVLEQWFAGADIPNLFESSTVADDKTQDIPSSFSILLGKILPHLDGFRELIRDLTTPMLVRDLAEAWYERNVGGIKDEYSDDRENGITVASEMINSILAMISVAKTVNSDSESGFAGGQSAGALSGSASDLSSGASAAQGLKDQHSWMLTEKELTADKKSLLPFLNVRSQLFVRSLVNVVTTVDRDPVLYLAADKADITCPLSLPLISCNSCDQNMWGGVCPNPTSSDAAIRGDLRDFYDKWFNNDPTVEILIPVKEESDFREHLRQHRKEVYGICPDCRRLFILDNPAFVRDYFEHKLGCPSCGSQNIVAVWKPNLRQNSSIDETVRSNVCPHCGARNTLRIMGSRSATLSAVVADMLNGSAFNQDHKIIAFNDSVQDAAFRGGFIAARNYHATVRRAIKNYLSSFIHGSNSLNESLKNFTNYWLGRFESQISSQEKLKEAGITDEHMRNSHVMLLKKAEFVSTFMPADMQWWRSWKSFTDLSLGSIREFYDALSSDFKDQFEALYNAVRQRLIFEFWTEITIRSPMVHSLLSSGTVAATLDPKILRKLKECSGEIVRDIQENFNLVTNKDSLNNLIAGLIYRLFTSGAIDPTGVQGKGRLGSQTIQAQSIENALYGYLRTGNLWLYLNGSKSRSILPNYGPKRLPPRGLALSLKSVQKDDYTEIIEGSGKKTWYTTWLFKNLDIKDVKLQVLVEDIYKTVLNHMKEAGILGCIKRDNGDLIWLVPFDSVYLSDDVRTLRCSCCGQKYNFASSLAEIMNDSPCLTESCTGTLKDADILREDQSTALAPVRIIEAEHTALISGDVREQVEKSFSRNNFSWGINFLSATPTLEMGIDIGSLSTVLLCNVPPSQANFLQRIGRAGRRDGNSIAITMVERSPHDLYYWADPEEMIKGDVRTPGVFLQAVSVLERQLFAFALGRWISENAANVVPKFLDIVLNNIIAMEQDSSVVRFPFDFLAWLHTHGKKLCDDFISLIEGSSCTSSEKNGGQRFRYLNFEKKRYLENFVLGSEKPDLDFEHDSLEHRLKTLLDRSIASRKSWNDKKKAVGSQIKNLKKKPQDQSIEEQLAELESQKSAILKYIDTTFTKMSFFNWLTDKGLLPNYAFPEESVSVDSIVIRRKEYIGAEKKAGVNQSQEQVSDSGAEDNSEEVSKQDETDASVSDSSRRKAENENVIKFCFSRSAADSLRSLAPNSIFYANGFSLHIDQVMMYDDDDKLASSVKEGGNVKKGTEGGLTRSSSIEKWRFCPDCSYMERIDLKLDDENTVACPQCGSEGFSDVGQVCDLLKIRELVAHADSRRDRITDDRDSREPNLQKRNLFISALDRDVINAWETADEKYSFGFEFLRNVSIREVNFGLSHSIKRNLVVNQESIQAPGFKICRCCGSVFNERRARAYIDGRSNTKRLHLHDITCPWYQKEMDENFSFDANSEPWISGLFLYRQVNSEAIRMRLPVSVMFNEKKARQVSYSLMAAMYLGLERYFKGNVSHLKICLQSDPDPEHLGEKAVYIVIYDTIPGGSGYLKDLMRNCESAAPKAGDTISERRSLNGDACSADSDSREYTYSNIIQLFRETADVLKNCSCRSSGRDGCYHCVYHYGDSLDRKFISRELAEEYIDLILKNCAAGCRKIPNLRKMKFNLDSFLEEKFFETICFTRGFSAKHNARTDGNQSCTLNVILSEQGRSNLRMVFPSEYTNLVRPAGDDEVSTENSVNEGDLIFAWKITFQEDFSKEYGYRSKPDFAFRPQAEKLCNLADLTMMVFTDGWRYHGGRNDLAGDTRKRQSILNQKMHVWSITMDDVTGDFSKNTALSLKRILSDEDLNNVKRRIKFDRVKEIAFKTYSEFLKSSDIDYSVLFNDLSEERFRRFLLENNSSNSFELLLEWLRDPLGFNTNMAVANCYRALTNLKKLSDISSEFSVIKAHFRSYYPPIMYSDFSDLNELKKNIWSFETEEGKSFTRGYRTEFNQSASCMRASLFVNTDVFADEGYEQDEKLKNCWRKILFSANIMQFCGHFWWCTKSNQYESCYDEDVVAVRKPRSEDRIDDRYIDELELEDDWKSFEFSLSVNERKEFGKILSKLSGRVIPPNCEIVINGYEDENGNICEISRCNALQWQVRIGRIYLFSGQSLNVTDDDFENLAYSLKLKNIWLISTNSPDWFNQLNDLLKNN
jgi:DEAD/DEAH box helicase domain-containing protein